MTADAFVPRGTPSDSLMLQVNSKNVLAVHALLAAQADALDTALQDAIWLREIPALADDVVSRDARDVFQPKVDHILDVHLAHASEVREAARRLKEAATQYRYTEDDIAAALNPARERFGLPPLPGR